MVSHTADQIDAIQSMLRKECYYRSEDYLQNYRFDFQLATSTKQQRAKLVDWCHKVTDYYQMDRDLAAIAVTNFDRFVSSRRNLLLDPQKVQLAMMTSLYTTIKINSRGSMKLKVITMMSKRRHNEKEIVEMEQDMISAVAWHLNPPTAMSFVRCFLSIISLDIIPEFQREIILHHSKLQLELSLREYCFALLDPSYIALGAFSNSLEVADRCAKEKCLHMLSIVSGIDVKSQTFKSVQDALLNIAKEERIALKKKSNFITEIDPTLAQSSASESICNSPRCIVSYN